MKKIIILLFILTLFIMTGCSFGGNEREEEVVCPLTSSEILEKVEFVSSFVPYTGENIEVVLNNQLDSDFEIKINNDKEIKEVGQYSVLVTVNYKGKTVLSKYVNFEIVEAAMNESQLLELLEFNDLEATYDGKSHILSYNDELPLGYSVKFSGEAKTEVGEYQFNIKVTYYGVEVLNVVKTLTIKAQEEIEEKVLTTDEIKAQITFNDQSVFYDGESHTLTYQSTLPSSYNLELVGSSQTEAGQYQFTLKITFKGEVVLEITKTLTIAKDNNYDVTTPWIEG